MTHRLTLSLIVFLSLIVGGVWAALLPAWDLNDEQQHVDYVRYISETGRLPVMGDGLISPAIAESVIATDRWSHLRLRRPGSMDRATWGLEGQSYQAYQPPLYYLLLVAPYEAWSQSTLAAMYGLRAITVVLATISAIVAYYVIVELTDGRFDLAFLGTVALVLIPERAQATSRVNNDVTTELFGGLFLLLVIQQWRSGPSMHRSIALGATVGLALLSKSSALILLIPLILCILFPTPNHSFTKRLRHLIVQTLVVMVVAGWHIARNQIIYGDSTGASAFLRLAQFEPTQPILAAIIALGQGLWITRWQGIAPLGLAIACWTLLILNMVSLVRYRQQIAYIGLLTGVAVLWTIPLLYGLGIGLVQTVEGRFVLGSLLPLIALAAVGAARITEVSRSRVLLGGLAATLGCANVATIVFFALPFYYGWDWSAR